MLVITRALNFDETKKLMVELMDCNAKMVDEFGIFEVDSYWVTHFVYEFQYNYDNNWIHKIDVPDHLTTYMILKYGSHENSPNK